MVVAMFAFAITATGLLYGYWRLHIAPFLPLQKAIAASFKDSRPRVEGGQRKIHKGTPHILRVTMKIDFDPNADEARATAFANRVVAFVRERQDLTEWEILEIHFYWPEPEKELHEWMFEQKVSELK
jgi:hypothetical protein